MTLAELLALLEDDREVVETLIAEGMLTAPIERCCIEVLTELYRA